MTTTPRKNPDLRRKLIIQQAEKVLRDEGLEDLGVDPIALAERHDILVQAKPDTAPGVSGMLMHVNTTFGILYATHITNDGFQRFSIAHELVIISWRAILSTSSPAALRCTPPRRSSRRQTHSNARPTILHRVC